MINLSPFLNVPPVPVGRVSRKLEGLFGVDLRSAALFRVLIALAAFADPAMRAAGVLFPLPALAAFLLLAGWRTRWMTFVSWLLLMSLQNRDPVLLRGGDVLLRCALFWGMFLPLGAKFSVDSALDTSGRTPPERALTFGTIAFLGEVAILGVFAGLIARAGEFPWVAIACMAAFVPSCAWRKASAAFRAGGRGDVTIYYDADCGFCKKSVHLLRTFLLLPGARIVTAQSDPAAFGQMTEMRSWIVRDAAGRSYFRYDAMKALFRESPFRPLASVLALFPRAGERAYALVSGHRRIAAKFLSWCRFREMRPEPVRHLNVVAVFFVVYALFWNLDTGKGASYRMPEPLRRIGVFLQLDRFRDIVSRSPQEKALKIE